MITGTFNGWNILALPSVPAAFSQLELVMQDKVSADPSPWTQQAQILDWQIDWWEATASLPQMQRAVAQQWIALLAECRGQSAAFLIGDPLANRPTGLAKGAPLVDGLNSTRSSTLTIRGLAPNLARQLLPGDHIQIGYRMHVNLDVANSDAHGKAALNLWPRIREAPNDGDPVIWKNPKGLFRLADNQRSYSLANTKLAAISLKLTEAL